MSEHKTCNICGKKNKTVKTYVAVMNDELVYLMCKKCKDKSKVSVKEKV